MRTTFLDWKLNNEDDEAIWDPKDFELLVWPMDRKEYPMLPHPQIQPPMLQWISINLELASKTKKIKKKEQNNEPHRFPGLNEMSLEIEVNREGDHEAVVAVPKIIRNVTKIPKVFF